MHQKNVHIRQTRISGPKKYRNSGEPLIIIRFPAVFQLCSIWTELFAVIILLLFFTVDHGNSAVFFLHFYSAVETDSTDRRDNNGPGGSGDTHERSDDSDCHGKIQDDGVILADADPGHIALFDKFFDSSDNFIRLVRCLIYADNYTNRDEGDDAALEKCLEYIAERKAEIKLLFSGNAEQYLAGFCLGIVNKKLEEKIADSTAEDHEESLLCAATSAAAVYGFIQIWITTNIDKSPKELVRILKKVVRSDIFL